MAACVLSPYGIYDSVESCNTEQQCNWKWKCVDGVPELAPDGTHDTEADCKCWDCTVDGCVANTTGDGDFFSQNQCDSECVAGYTCTADGPVLEVGGVHSDPDECKYVCNRTKRARGNQKRLREPTDPSEGTRFDDVKCRTCDGNDTSSVTDDGYLGNTLGLTCEYTCEVVTERDPTNNTPGLSRKVFVESGGEPASTLKCYTCDAEIANPSLPVPRDGLDGNHGDPAAGSCTYVCDGVGQKIYGTSGMAVDEFECYDCTGESEYSYVDEGSTGTFAGTDGLGCLYWCEDGEPQAVSDADKASAGLIDDADLRDSITSTTLADTKCYTCSGESGPDSTCTVVPSQTKGVYESVQACEQDPVQKCGWGYGCQDNECALTASAERGRTHTECLMDSDEQCGWKYDCFMKFTCVDGVTCAGASDEDCETRECYDSEEACIANSACSVAWNACDAPLDGTWEFDPMPGSFTFIKGDLDSDGYRWYESDLRVEGDDSDFMPVDAPMIEIGFRDVEQGGSMLIEMKARGYTEQFGFLEEFFTSEGNGLYRDPDSHVIAEVYGDTCFSMDSIDLATMCGSTTCIWGVDSAVLRRKISGPGCTDIVGGSSVVNIHFDANDTYDVGMDIYNARFTTFESEDVATDGGWNNILRVQGEAETYMGTLPIFLYVEDTPDRIIGNLSVRAVGSTFDSPDSYYSFNFDMEGSFFDGSLDYGTHLAACLMGGNILEGDTGYAVLLG